MSRLNLKINISIEGKGFIESSGYIDLDGKSIPEKIECLSNILDMKKQSIMIDYINNLNIEIINMSCPEKSGN